jgi:hypothetical protein
LRLLTSSNEFQQSLFSIVDIIIIQRWNIAVGINDRLMYMFENAVLESLLDVLQSMPRAAIYAKLSPPGMESSVFAYTCGIQNFSNMLKGLMGSGIIQWSGMITIDESSVFALSIA